MKIVVPTAAGKLCLHFGHCEVFTAIEVDQEKKEILAVEHLNPPPHEPGVLPRWLAEQGANCIISGGMGMRAQNLFEENNIQVITGARVDDPQVIVEEFLNNRLETGPNTCDH